MSFSISDLMSAVEKYEEDNVDTRIVDFKVFKGNVLNEGEYFGFAIRVHNQSHLDMRNVTVQAVGTQWVDVTKGPFFMGQPTGLGPYVISSPPFNLDAHQVHLCTGFVGRANQATEGAKDIVMARIYRWDASLDHVLRDHTGMGPKEGKLHVDISPG